MAEKTILRALKGEVVASLAPAMIAHRASIRERFQRLVDHPAAGAAVGNDAAAIGDDAIMAEHAPETDGDDIAGAVIMRVSHRKTICRFSRTVKLAGDGLSKHRPDTVHAPPVHRDF